MKKENHVLMMFALLALAGCGGQKEKREAAPVRVTTEKVSLGMDYAQSPYVGQVQEASSTAVSFMSAGTVSRVYVEEGQRVSRGQLIAEMDNTSARNALLAAEASLRQAKDAYERMKQLHDDQTLPEMQWVEVQSKLQQAQSVYELSKKNVADCRLVAPVSGIVGQKFVDAGETAMPGSPVVTLLDISHVKVKVSVPENEINGIPTSVASTIKVAALGGETFQGGRIVKHVASDAMTHSYGIQIHLANPSGRLLPGMVCTVRFNHEGNPQITVPVTAVQRGQGQSLYVWTISNGRVRQQPVSTGETYGSRIVITDGLKERDSVVTAGWQKLSNGSKVSAL